MDIVPPCAINVRLPTRNSLRLACPPEIVVIVENQDAGLVASDVAIEIAGSEAADACSDDDQIVDLAGGLRLPGLSPRLAIAQPMRIGKGAVVVSAHAGEGRGIVAGSFFGRVNRFA